MSDAPQTDPLAAKREALRAARRKVHEAQQVLAQKRKAAEALQAQHAEAIESAKTNVRIAQRFAKEAEAAVMEAKAEKEDTEA